MTASVEVEGLTKRYGAARGVQDLAFQVEDGEVFGFLGPIGAGKTTTIRVLLALLRPDTGVARIGGLNCWRQAVAVKHLVVQGELDALLKAASRHHVVNLLSQEPSLEKIFLRYYQGNGSSAREAGHVAG